MNKNTAAKPQQKGSQFNMPKRAENKDNLDSRSGEEQLDKGDDTTHNKGNNIVNLNRVRDKTSFFSNNLVAFFGV